MPTKIIFTFAALLILFSAFGCVETSTKPISFGREILLESNYNVAVGFDLREDRYPKCGLLINEKRDQNTRVEHKVVVLPFPTSQVNESEELLSTWGCFHNSFTILSYQRNPLISGQFIIQLTPTLEQFSRSDFAVINGSSFESGIYLISDGLEREFIYGYNNSNPRYKEIILAGYAIQPEAIAVALPSKAEGREIEGGKTSIPLPVASNRIAKFYPSSSTEPGVNNLRIRYVLPPSPGQDKFADIAVKLLATVASPLLALYFLRPGEIKSPRRRKIVLWLLILIELAAVAWIIYIGIISSDINRILDLAVAFTGIVFSGIVFWIKK